MKHKAQSDATSFQPWSHCYGAQLAHAEMAIASHGLLHQLPLTPVPCWKLYENPFYVDGKLFPAYRSRYLNAPVHRAANCFTSANLNSPPKNAIAVVNIPKKGSHLSLAGSISIDNQPPNSIFLPCLSTVHFALEASSANFSEHHNVARLALRHEPPSGPMNVQVSSNNQGNSYMASVNMQTTLASIVQRLRHVEESQSRSNATIPKLRLQMEDALSRIQELEFSHESALREINGLLQRFGEQMAMSRRKEQEKLRTAFMRLREEIKEERSTCTLLKLQNKKLMKELEEANMIAADAGEELDRERKARELMEEVCNELAREIGEDKAEVEQLKQEQAKSREMVEQELKMMRMSALWRDERPRSKFSEADQLELELDDTPVVGLHELKSTLEECVSKVRPAHEGNAMDEQQETTIEQARMLRRALELTMRQLPSEGVLRADRDNEEGKAFAPISNRACFSTSASSIESFADGHEREEPSMYHIDHVELQIKPTNNLLKRSSNNVRRLRAPSGANLGYPVGAMQARKPLELHTDDEDYDHDHALQNMVSGDVTDRILAPHHNKSKNLGESKDPWSASDRKGPSAPMSRARSELHTQKHGISSCTHMVKGVHQRHSSLHLDDEAHNGHNDDQYLPANIKVHSLSDDDVGQGNTINVREQSRRQHFTQSATDGFSKTKQGDENTHPHIYGFQEGVRNVHGCNPTHLHEYDHAGACVEGEGEEQGEFDDFYYEPVMNGVTQSLHVLEDNCEASYGTPSNAEGHDVGIVEVEDSRLAGCGDQPVASKSTLREATLYDPVLCGNDGNRSATLSASYGGMSGKAGTKQVPAPPIRMLMHLPSQGGAKTHCSPKNIRSVSPIKQCFRRPPTSPPCDDMVPSAPNYNKEHGAPTACSTKTGALSSPEVHMDGRTMETQSGASVDGLKNNSLRTELLKARELDLEYTVHRRHCHVKSQAARKSSSSAFKLSPLRRSLTHSHSR